MDGLLPLFGAGIAVIALVALSSWLGFRGVPRLEGAAEAGAIAQALPGGFSAVQCAVDGHASAALLADAGGRLALVGSHGAHFIVREVDGSSSASCNDGVITISTTGLRARLELGAEATGWMELLRQAGVQT